MLLETYKRSGSPLISSTTARSLQSKLQYQCCLGLGPVTAPPKNQSQKLSLHSEYSCTPTLTYANVNTNEKTRKSTRMTNMNAVASPSSDFSVYFDADGGLTERSERSPGKPDNMTSTAGAGTQGGVSGQQELNTTGAPGSTAVGTDGVFDEKNNTHSPMLTWLGSSPADTTGNTTVPPINNAAQGPPDAQAQTMTAEQATGSKQATGEASAVPPANPNGTTGAGTDNALKTPMTTRAETAENQLNAESLAKITKAEAKDAKKEVSVLNGEAKTQSKLLASASSDLSKQQKAQKAAASGETKALKAHSKAIKTEHKTHSKFLAAKAKYEKAVADVKSKEELLESSRQHSQKASELLGSKMAKVDELKKLKSVDDRERQVKLDRLQDTIRQKKSH